MPVTETSTALGDKSGGQAMQSMPEEPFPMAVTETSTSLGDMSLAIALDASVSDDKQVEAIPDSPDTPTKAAITYAWEDAGDKGRFNGYVTLLKTGTYKIVYDDGAAFEVYYSANGANDIFVTHAPKEDFYFS